VIDPLSISIVMESLNLQSSPLVFDVSSDKIVVEWKKRYLIYFIIRVVERYSKVF